MQPQLCNQVQSCTVHSCTQNQSAARAFSYEHSHVRSPIAMHVQQAGALRSVIMQCVITAGARQVQSAQCIRSAGAVDRSTRQCPQSTAKCSQQAHADPHCVADHTQVPHGSHSVRCSLRVQLRDKRVPGPVACGLSRGLWPVAPGKLLVVVITCASRYERLQPLTSGDCTAATSWAKRRNRLVNTSALRSS
jgi:hypothetical protein